ncbi:MAG: helix-turn-helix domain-containing protein [Alphaproteobacteria bacterium]|nr:helix-turn-helix domain-containing protein [Alphaproteobacteria bacterium]
MNQIKIGKFIGEQRKVHNLTQSELSEKLGITDRAISKWERGICLPDAGLMLNLCSILEISVNELLTGEKITMENNTKITDANLIELAKKNEQANKMLLGIEKVLLVLLALILATCPFLFKNYIDSPLAKGIITGVMIAVFIGIIILCLHIEHRAGYYECKKCGNKYVPEFKNILFALHLGTTRRMKCPMCGKKSWQKKVLK